LVVLAALLLSLAGCLGTIADTPKREDSTQNVGTGEGDDDQGDGDGDASSSDDSSNDDGGEGDADNGDDDAPAGGDGDVSSVDDPDDAYTDDPPAEDPATDDPADDPPGDDPPADDPPADDPPAEEPPVSSDPEAESLARGEESYDQLCVGCHGANGQGRGGVRKSNDLGQLADIIDGSMPLGNASACSGTCPEDIARYILATF
jgi:hypothetical protein